MRRHRHERGEGRENQPPAAEPDRFGEGGSGYGSEGIGRPVTGYGSQGGGFGMGGSPGDDESGHRIGAVGEMGLRAMPDPPRNSWGEESFRGRGPRGYRRSDQRILEDVCDRLTDDHDIDASDIEVAVAAGEVTLEGTVTERHVKWLAEEVASGCSGVHQVHNHLRVQPVGVEAQSPTDH